MGSVKVHKIFDSFEDAADEYAKLSRKEPHAELWRCIQRGKERYAVVLKVKTRGRNPNIRLLEELSGNCPECCGPAVAVWKKGEVKALKCLRGHRKKRTGRLELYHPVFLV